MPPYAYLRLSKVDIFSNDGERQAFQLPSASAKIAWP
jgi:hypothetical protein